MWYITNKKTQHVYYLVTQPTGHTVGRTGTDLIITDDDSISRNHAMLQPQQNVLILTDTGSRYGSYVNQNIEKTIRISQNEPTALKPGDMVRFGRLGSVWQVGKVDFRCLTSTLIMDEDLKTILRKVGAELVSNYTAGLTHLIMPTVTITTKFLQCLIGQVPIVKPDFFKTIGKDCIGQGKALPSVTDFVPTCTEPYIKNQPLLCHPNPARSSLFRGKEFIFLNTAQCGQFETIIKLAGGVCLCAQREKIVKSRFLKRNVITVKLNAFSSSQSQSQSFDRLSQHLTTCGRRMVPDMEIGLALIFCSTEKYCNPEYSFAFNVEECNSSAEGGETMAKSTEQQTENTDGKGTNVAEINTIPETEQHIESKQGTTTSKTNIMSILSTSSFLVPKIVSKDGNVPEGRRKSKRMQEALKDKEQTIEHEECNLAKRPSRNSTPVESVSYSPVVDSKQNTATECESGELHIPETQPTANSALSQALQARGFRGVNHGPMELGERKGKEPVKRRRGPNLDINLDDDEMLIFDEFAPRKKPCRAKTIENPTGPSQAVRNNNNAPVEVDALLCFDETPGTQRRRTANQRKTAPVVALNNLSKCSTVSSNTSLSRPVDVPNRSTSNDSTLHSYRELIKSVQPSTMRWLSSTVCGLKLEGGNENSPIEMKIKSEPLDALDDPYGKQAETKKWIESVIPMREVSMKLVAHRPIDVSGQELSCVASDGGKNFKAFVKNRNYTAQKLVLAMKHVCIQEESQSEVITFSF